jgi:hypothetical protein
MLGREVICREIERIEGRLKILYTMTNTSGVSVTDFQKEILNIEEKIDNLRGMVDREPFSGHEINVKSQNQ